MGRWVRRTGAARILLRALVAVVVLVGVARAGSRYFYCPVMDAVLAQPCCGQHSAAGHDDPATPDSQITKRECCEEATLAGLPDANPENPELVAPDAPPLPTATSVLPLVLARSDQPRAPVSPHGIPPPPLAAKSRCAVLRTFLL